MKFEETETATVTRDGRVDVFRDRGRGPRWVAVFHTGEPVGSEAEAVTAVATVLGAAPRLDWAVDLGDAWAVVVK